MFRKRLFAWLLVLFWLAVVVYLSSQNGDDSSALSGLIVQGVMTFCGKIGLVLDGDTVHFIVRKMAHFGVHFVLMLLTYYAARISFKKQKVAIIFCLIFGICCAVFDEYVQLGAAGRTAAIFDIMINLNGILFGILFGILSFRRKA